METTVPLQTLNRALVRAATFLCVAGVSTEVVMYGLDGYQLYGFLPLLGLSYEDSLATWYSSMLLYTSSLALAAVAVSKAVEGDDYARHWKVLAGIFLYISIDEAISIHELLNTFISFPGYLFFGWVVPAAILVAIFVLSYLRFLSDLPARTRNGFLAAGATYVGGALGVELLLGKWTSLHGEANLTYGMIDAVEETMEIAGISLLLTTVAAYLSADGKNLRLSVGGGPTATMADNLSRPDSS